MRVTMYPYQPFEVTNQKITVFSTNSADVYTKLIAGFKDQQEILKISDDQFQLIDIVKSVLWGGEISTLDPNKLFQSRLIKKMAKDLTDDQRQNLVGLDSQMRAAILEAAFMYDLALDIDLEWDVQKALKYFNLKFSNDIQTNPYGIMESIVATASELNETKIIVLMNVSHYLSISQFNELVRLMATLNVKLFIIEFSETSNPTRYQECRYYHIDTDYVEWRYDSDEGMMKK
ncbi:type II-A CRISPR-associated protein Csn2 [Latilactobacillus fuchuensis]|uniref:Type II-A CRISPR-associated protein Csn2 n=1 Tax=Latilactobacillus fuchuensis TaxID=164393 RepID=A0A2N9DVZ5_9LACO|nr:conserved hypothetical protein [Latilactobacillus fuchuensis]